MSYKGQVTRRSGVSCSDETTELHVPSLEIEQVIGLSSKATVPVALSPKGISVYIAGRILVLYDPIRNVQISHLKSPLRSHPLACVTFGREGELVAAGEVGSSPSPLVLVWDLSLREQTAKIQLSGHIAGIDGVSFSQNGEFLASIGSQDDGHIFVWDIKTKNILYSQKINAGALASVAFSADAKRLLTAGKEHLKLWYLSGSNNSNSSSSNHNNRSGQKKASASQLNNIINNVVTSKSLTTGNLKGVTFSDVKVGGMGNEGGGKGSASSILYALSNSGTLYMIKAGGSGASSHPAVEKQVNLQVKHAYSLSISDSKVACACAEGTVKIYTVKNLTFWTNLPEPCVRANLRYRSYSSSTATTSSSLSNIKHNSISNDKKNKAVSDIMTHSTLPDAISCAFGNSGDSLAVVYEDSTLLFWDIRNKNKITCYQKLESHASAIADIFPLSRRSMDDYYSHGHGQQQQHMSLSPVSQKMQQFSDEKQEQTAEPAFVTCSSDGTARLWKLRPHKPAPISQRTMTATHRSNRQDFNSNAASLSWFYDSGHEEWQKKVKVIEVGTHSQNINHNNKNQQTNTNSNSKNKSNDTHSKNNNASNLSHNVKNSKIRHGPKTMLKNVSIGSKKQSVIIQNENIELSDLQAICVSPTGEHVAIGDTDGILRIFDSATTKLITKKEKVHLGAIIKLDYSALDSEGSMYLATAGVDGKINIYDANESYDLVHSLVGHEDAVTGLCFAEGSGPKILSCGKDKYMFIRRVESEEDDDTVEEIVFDYVDDVDEDDDNDVMLESNANGMEIVHRQYMLRSDLVDMHINVEKKTAMTLSRDSKIRVWCLETGDMIHVIETLEEADEPIKITQGPNAQTVLVCHANGMLCVYEYYSGEILAYGRGHANNLTGAVNVGSHIVTVGEDGCIFIWSAGNDIGRRAQEAALINGQKPTEKAFTTEVYKNREDEKRRAKMSITPKDLRRSISPPQKYLKNGRPMLSTSVLPKWANMRSNDSDDGVMMMNGGMKTGDSMKYASQLRPPKLDLRKLTSDNCCDDLEEDSLLPVVINSPANYAEHHIDLGNLSDRYAKPLDSGPGYSQDAESLSAETSSIYEDETHDQFDPQVMMMSRAGSFDIFDRPVVPEPPSSFSTVTSGRRTITPMNAQSRLSFDSDTQSNQSYNVIGSQPVQITQVTYNQPRVSQSSSPYALRQQERMGDNLIPSRTPSPSNVNHGVVRMPSGMIGPNTRNRGSLSPQNVNNFAYEHNMRVDYMAMEADAAQMDEAAYAAATDNIHHHAPWDTRMSMEPLERDVINMDKQSQHQLYHNQNELHYGSTSSNHPMNYLNHHQNINMDMNQYQQQQQSNMVGRSFGNININGNHHYQYGQQPRNGVIDNYPSDVEDEVTQHHLESTSESDNGSFEYLNGLDDIEIKCGLVASRVAPPPPQLPINTASSHLHHHSSSPVPITSVNESQQEYIEQSTRSSFYEERYTAPVHQHAAVAGPSTFDNPMFDQDALTATTALMPNALFNEINHNSPVLSNITCHAGLRQQNNHVSSMQETSRVAYDRLHSIGIGSRNEGSRLAISHSGLMDEEDLNMQQRSSQNMRPIQRHKSISFAMQDDELSIGDNMPIFGKDNNVMVNDESNNELFNSILEKTPSSAVAAGSSFFKSYENSSKNLSSFNKSSGSAKEIINEVYASDVSEKLNGAFSQLLMAAANVKNIMESNNMDHGNYLQKAMLHDLQQSMFGNQNVEFVEKSHGNAKYHMREQDELAFKKNLQVKILGLIDDVCSDIPRCFRT